MYHFCIQKRSLFRLSRCFSQLNISKSSILKKDIDYNCFNHVNQPRFVHLASCQLKNESQKAVQLKNDLEILNKNSEIFSKGTKNYPDISLEKFNQVLKILVHFKNRCNSQNILNIRDSDYEKFNFLELADSLSKNPSNWSIFYDFMETVLNFNPNKPIIKKSNSQKQYASTIVLAKNTNLKHEFDKYVFACITKLQSIYSEPKTEQKYFDYLERCADLADSFFTFISNDSRYKIENQTNLLGRLIDTKIFILEEIIEIQKDIPKNLYANNELYKKINDKTLVQLNLLMRNYSSFDAVSDIYKPKFIEYFSFFKDKWFFVTKWLLQNQNYSSYKSAYKPCLRGAIYFDEFDTFNSLLERFESLNRNDIYADGNIEDIFEFYLKLCHRLKGFEFEKELGNIFSVWEKLSFIPNESFLNNNLKEFIENSDVNGNEKLVLQKVNINSNGFCREKNFHIEKLQEFNQSDLNLIADQIKEYAFSRKEFPEVYRSVFDRMDQILKRNKFDYVIDGLNINHYRLPADKKLKHNFLNLLVDSLDKERENKILIVARKYALRKFEKSMPEWRKTYDNTDFFILEDELPDDWFVTYAALKSKTTSKFISNDCFKNQLSLVNNKTGEFKKWLISNRLNIFIDLKPELKLIFINGPSFEVRTRRINENLWVIPVKILDVEYIKKNFFIILLKKIKSVTLSV